MPDLLRAQALMWSTSTFPDGASADMQRVGLWTAQRLAEATELARRSGDGPALLAVLERTIRSLRITLLEGEAAGNLCIVRAWPGSNCSYSALVIGNRDM